MTVSQTPFTLYIGVAVVGLGFAPQYPLYVTWLAKAFREDANWLGAFYFGSGGLGGAVIPWLVGIIASHTNSLRAGLILPVAVIAAMFPILMRLRPRRVPT